MAKNRAKISRSRISLPIYGSAAASLATTEQTDQVQRLPRSTIRPLRTAASTSSFNVLSKTQFGDWVSCLTQRYQVFGPKSSGRQYSFGVIQTAEDLVLNFEQAPLSLKKCILPPQELLCTYETNGECVQAVIESVPTVILGVRTCDQHAIRLLDRVFTQGYTDQHYQSRRESTLIVGLECLRPCGEQSFCHSMGTSSPATEVFDLHLVDFGRRVLFRNRLGSRTRVGCRFSRHSSGELRRSTASQ